MAFSADALKKQLFSVKRGILGEKYWHKKGFTMQLDTEDKISNGHWRAYKLNCTVQKPGYSSYLSEHWTNRQNFRNLRAGIIKRDCPYGLKVQFISSEAHQLQSGQDDQHSVQNKYR